MLSCIAAIATADSAPFFGTLERWFTQRVDPRAHGDDHTCSPHAMRAPPLVRTAANLA
jgi:hypothetical protein